MQQRSIDQVLHDFKRLPSGEIHVWSSALELDSESIGAWEAVLSQDERCRANRFRFGKDYVEFVLARSLLRCLIGSYLGLEAATIQFVYSPFGKPAIHPDLEPKGLRFNVSHSHGEALFAFSHNREVGIDLEFIPHEWDGSSLSQHFFSSRENEQLQTLADIEQKQAFFRCWTRKEAYIKARGEGLSLALNQFDVSLLAEEKAALLEVRPDAQEVNRWKMQDVAVKSNYAGALVAEGQDWNATQFRVTTKDSKCSSDQVKRESERGQKRESENGPRSETSARETDKPT
jgi:4'-phosphopantetheinyl transferase